MNSIRLSISCKHSSSPLVRNQHTPRGPHPSFDSNVSLLSYSNPLLHFNSGYTRTQRTTNDEWPTVTGILPMLRFVGTPAVMGVHALRPPTAALFWFVGLLVICTNIVTATGFIFEATITSERCVSHILTTIYHAVTIPQPHACIGVARSCSVVAFASLFCSAGRV